MYVYTSSKLHRRLTDERVACIFAVTPHTSRRFLPLAVPFRLFVCLYLQQVVRFLAAVASRVKPILHCVYTRMNNIANNRGASYRTPDFSSSEMWIRRFSDSISLRVMSYVSYESPPEVGGKK